MQSSLYIERFRDYITLLASFVRHQLSRVLAAMGIRRRRAPKAPPEPTVWTELGRILDSVSPVSTSVDEAIVNIDADPDFYYGEIPRSDLQKIIDEAPQHGIEWALAKYAADNEARYFNEYALDLRRATCLQLLGGLEGKRIIDYGCGLGTLGVSAALQGARVTFVDSCLMRLEVVAKRIADRNLLHNEFYACRSWHSLPAQVQNFDGVILNGILEWIPTTVGSHFESVITTQLEFLADMSRRLKDTGKIILAIENRFAFKYFMGYPEDHTGILNLSLMPRAAANDLHRQVEGSDYTSWTWSLDDYNTLLPKAGLFVSEAYGVFPDYRFPRLIVDLNDTTGLKEGMLLEDPAEEGSPRRRFLDYIAEMGLLRHFVYSYCLVLERLNP